VLPTLPPSAQPTSHQSKYVPQVAGGVSDLLYACADTVTADEPQHGDDRDRPEDRVHGEPERRGDRHDDDGDEDVH
jgi:hypothetical protein